MDGEQSTAATSSVALDPAAGPICRSTPRSPSRWPRFDRFLVLLSATGATAAIIADANPWHFVVLEDVVLPIGAVLSSVGVGVLVMRRWGRGFLSHNMRVFDGLPLALQVAALAVAAGIASGLAMTAALVLVFVQAAWSPDDSVVMATHTSSDVEVVVERSGCSSSQPHSESFLHADRKLASRRVLLGVFNDCGGYYYEFLVDENVVVVEDGTCWSYRVEFDPDTLMILDEQSTDARVGGCDTSP